ncbi:MAG: chemotaxis protein CheX [Lachnospiraceae bacterium]|nr:chemotaxis protein CheX [Lachnospiraceae bacterium]
MGMNTVSAVFEQAFLSVSSQLLGIQMQKREKYPGFSVEEPVCHVMIRTIGYIQLEITCLFPQKLVQQIVSCMHGGKKPPDEEVPLYIKEYVNIVCGRGISDLNDQYGKASRLSVPFYQEEIMHEDGLKEQKEAVFENEYGAMLVVMCCSKEKQLSKEGLQNGYN